MLRVPRMAPFGWLAAANFAFGLAFGIYQTIFFNFIGQDLGISPHQLGLLETVREIPGLLTVGIAALVMTVAEPVVGAAALLLLGASISMLPMPSRLRSAPRPEHAHPQAASP